MSRLSHRVLGRTGPHHLGWLVAVSFVPLIFKSLVYLPIGSSLPAALCVGFGAVVIVGFRLGDRWRFLAVRAWSAAILMWATARLILQVLFLLVPQQEAHVNAQLTLWYLLTSVVFVGVGMVLWRAARSPGVGLPP